MYPHWTVIVTAGSLAVATPLCGQAVRATGGQLPFDTTLRRLPRAFAADDIARVAAGYQLPPRGEYEAASSFEARSSRLRSRSIAFRVNDSCNSYELHYDPEIEAFDFTAVLDAIQTTPTESDAFLAVACTSVSRGPVPMANAFGVRVNVTLVRHTTYWLRLLNALHEARASYNLHVVLPVPLRIAPRYRTRIRVLAVATTSPSDDQYVTTDTSGEEPTIASPQSVERVATTLFVSSLAIWLYDAWTGDVLAKVPLPAPCPGDTGPCIVELFVNGPSDR